MPQLKEENVAIVEANTREFLCSHHKQEIRYLYSELKKINLVDFLQKEIGLVFKKNGNQYSCLCPMANHKDSIPSFNVYKSSSENGGECWVYHCFGCGSGGTIIDFCMDYWALEHPYDAIVFLVQKLNITNTYEMVVKAIKEAHIEINIRKKIDGEHFIVSKKCYNLLKQYYNNPEIKNWIYQCYKTLNEALKYNDIKLINKVSNNISERSHILKG